MGNSPKSPSPPRIAVKYFVRNPARSVITLVVIMVAVAMVYSTLMLTSQSEKNVEDVVGLMGADVVIVPQGNRNTFEDILLVGKPSSMYMKDEIYEKVLKIDHVRRATPQLYAVTLSENYGCCGLTNVQVVGIDPETDFIISKLLPEGFKLGRGECIIAYTVVGSVGQTLSFFGKSFEIKYRLPYTGTPLDYVVIVRLDDLREALTSLPFSSTDYTDLISAVFVEVDDPKYIEYVSAKASRIGMVDVVTRDSISASAFRALENTFKSLRLYTAMTLALSAIAIAGVLLSGVDARRKEIGLLKALGAKNPFVIRIYVYESIIFSLIGWICGIIAGSAIFKILSKFMLLTQFELALNLILLPILVSFLVAVLLSMIPGIYSFHMARKLSPSSVVKL